VVSATILAIVLALVGTLTVGPAPRNPVARAATPAASPVTGSGDFSGLVNIGNGRRLYLTCRGKGSPTVILVAGYRDRGDPWSTDLLQPASRHTIVLPGVATFTRVCAYERPGTALDAAHISRSDPVPQPQTAVAAVADLHALLTAASIPGPYVLVGHSFGGLLVRLYASTYPSEVGGLVLVDALQEEVTARNRAALTPEQWAALERLMTQPLPGLEGYPDLETVDFETASAQMRAAAAAHPLPSLPVVVLSRGRPQRAADLPPAMQAQLPSDFPWDTYEKAWGAGQAELAALVPGTRHVIASESGHYIQRDQPELVIAAIRQVVAAVRDPRTWSTPAASTPAP
jgi:pimeloyl-ACP methyl ester carboxylesterase